MSSDLSFSTDGAPEAARFDARRELNLGAFGVLFEPLHTAPAGDSARGEVRLKGSLGLFRYQADGTHVLRGASQIARRTWNGYMIQRQRGGLRCANPVKDFHSRPGALIIGASEIPWESWAEAHYDHDVLIVPKALMDPHLPATGRPVVAMLARLTGFEALAAEYFDSLARQWDELDEKALEAAAGVLCRLIGVALGARAELAPEAGAAGRLAAAKRHVEARLGDWRLDAASAAAALRISERTLEGVFAQAGLSFATYVRRRRLEECREALRVNPARSIADVAFAWGFNSLSSFYRAFVAEFGVSPGDLREQRTQSEPAKRAGAPSSAAMRATAPKLRDKPSRVRRPA
jgi:AraC-like DNA-binding protein